MRDSRMGPSSYGHLDAGLDPAVDYTPPDRRHSMGDVLEEPNSAEHRSRSRAASSVDNINTLGPKAILSSALFRCCPACIGIRIIHCDSRQ